MSPRRPVRFESGVVAHLVTLIEASAGDPFILVTFDGDVTDFGVISADDIVVVNAANPVNAVSVTYTGDANRVNIGLDAALDAGQLDLFFTGPTLITFADAGIVANPTHYLATIP